MTRMYPAVAYVNVKKNTDLGLVLCVVKLICTSIKLHNSLFGWMLHNNNTNEPINIQRGFQPVQSAAVYIQEAQLQQRNSASVVHVYLGWLTDRAMHRTRQNRRVFTICDIQTL